MQEMKFSGVLIVATLFFALPFQEIIGQKPLNLPACDSVRLASQNILVFKDSIFIPGSDTLIFIPKGTPFKIRKNPYKKSDALYDSLYNKTKGNLISRELYQLFITRKPDENSDIYSSGRQQKSDASFEPFLGKTIGSIRFVQVDVLEGSVDDTTKSATSGVGEFLKRTHVNTREWILHNYMLVKTGDKVNPGILSDNERIMRELPGISDARFLLVEDKKNQDLVQLIVITRDIFPIGITASASGFEKFNFGLWNYNTLGLNFDFGGSMKYDADFSPSTGYEIKSGFRNFRGSFIEGEISYTNAFSTNSLRLSLSKKFVSPLTKYGGELQLDRITDSYSLESDDTLIEGVYKANVQDVWLGRSFLLGDKKSRTNIILSARYEREKFFERPFVDADSNIEFHNSRIYLGKIAFSKLSYYKSRLIRAFEISEDIPYGIIGGLTFGYLDDEYFGRTYLGANVAAAKYFDKLGYFSGTIMAGGFYKDGKVSQGLFEMGMFYYTPLKKINLYALRNFAHINYQGAITEDVEAKVNFGDFMRNLDQKDISGQSTLVLNYEIVMFSPWFFYGFRFAPYLFADLGLISNSRNVFYKSNFYSAPGVGIRIGNESMAFKSAVIGVGILPNRPPEQGSLFFILSIGISDFITLLEIQKPFILRREVIFPY